MTMSKSAIRFNHDKHTRVERSINKMHHYEMLVQASTLVVDRPAKELDDMLRDCGFNLSDKE